jgi:hypothetical protein
MVRQQIQGWAIDRGAILLLAHRQLQQLQLPKVASSEPLEGIGRQLVVQARLGSTPLQNQPLGPLSARCRPHPLQHLQGPVRGLAAQQAVGISQHHRKRLGGWVDGEQPLLQLAQQRPIAPPHGTDTGSFEGIEISIAQQGNQGWISAGSCGFGLRFWGRGDGDKASQRSAKNWQQPGPGGEWRWYCWHV